MTLQDKASGSVVSGSFGTAVAVAGLFTAARLRAPVLALACCFPAVFGPFDGGRRVARVGGFFFISTVVMPTTSNSKQSRANRDECCARRQDGKGKEVTVGTYFLYPKRSTRAPAHPHFTPRLGGSESEYSSTCRIKAPGRMWPGIRLLR